MLASLSPTVKFALRRKSKTKQRVMAAASRILRRGGYPSLTMEAVANESGVAKTTLYRSWPTKSALCMDLYLDVAGHELRDPATGDVEEDLKEIASAVVRLQTRTVAGPAFIGLITEAQANPNTRSAFLEFTERRREITKRVLDRAKAQGELRPDTDVDLVIDTLGGAVTFRLLQCHASLTEEFTDGVVRLVLSGCRAKRSMQEENF